MRGKPASKARPRADVGPAHDVHGGARRPAAELAARAQARGEPVSVERLVLALKMATAAVFWRIAVSEAPMGEACLDDLADLIRAAVRPGPDHP